VSRGVQPYPRNPRAEGYRLGYASYAASSPSRRGRRPVAAYSSASHCTNATAGYVAPPISSVMASEVRASRSSSHSSGPRARRVLVNESALEVTRLESPVAHHPLGWVTLPRAAVLPQ
jgi:hypothetical protein